MCKIYNVSNQKNCWYMMFLSLHWWNNIEIFQNNKFHPPQACPLAHLTIFKIFNKHKNLNENYIEFDFSMGAVLVIFSFFWMENAPWPSPICKTFNIHHRKKNENYVEFYFSMGSVLMIFSFFWMDNLVCACAQTPRFSWNIGKLFQQYKGNEFALIEKHWHIAICRWAIPLPHTVYLLMLHPSIVNCIHNENVCITIIWRLAS